jgi:predicted transposase/invertase (TIGR01784 family)
VVRAMMDLLDPKTDYIFKTIFGAEDKKPLLISFLNALFKGRPRVKTITFENTDIHKILEKDKASRLDIRATTDDGTKLDIEIQFDNTGEIPERAIHYLCDIVPKAVQSGKSYNGPNVIGIWILANNVTTRHNAISQAYVTFQPNKPDTYDILSDNFRIIFIELKKFNPQKEDIRDTLTAWLSFLANPVFMDAEFLQIEEVKEAMETLKYISADDEVRAIADLRRRTINDRNSELTVAKQMGKEEGLAEGEAKGKAAGIAEGIAEGEAKGRRETALVMLNKGLSLEMVSACTGLSMEEIKALAQ